jgi:outer membrane biosynthesis protein TonB
MINDTTLGLIVAAVPLLIIGFLALRRLPAVFAFFVVLLAVGLGYLQTTGAIRDFGKEVRATLPAGMLPDRREAKPAADTSTTTTPTEAPAMAPAEPAPAPTPPAAEPAPEPTPAPETPPASTEPAPTTPAPAPAPAPANP